MIPKLSASRLALYLSCPHLYKDRYIDEHISSVDNVYALRGTAIHEALSSFFQGQITQDEIETKYSDILLDLVKHSISLSHAGKFTEVFVGGLTMLRQLDYSKFRPRESERRFELLYPNTENPVCILRGSIDLVQEDGFCDFKTTYARISKKRLSQDIQFKVYTWAYTQLYEKPPEQSYLIHLRTGAWVPYTHVEDDTLQTAIETLLHDTTFIPRWNNGPCAFCPAADLCYEEIYGSSLPRVDG